MSYQRDKDAHTRGPGAIASLDRRGSRAAQRARGIAASNARDAQRAALTYGTRGGLGMINTGRGTGLKIGPSMMVAGVVEGGSGLGPVPLPPSGTGGGMRTVRPPITLAPIRGGMLRSQPMIDNVMVDPAYPGTTPPPVKPLTPPKPLPVYPTGGGGGGGIVSGGRGTSTVTGGGGGDPPVDVPDAEPAAPSSSKNWLLLALAVGGAWLLLRDDKDGDS